MDVYNGNNAIVWDENRLVVYREILDSLKWLYNHIYRDSHKRMSHEIWMEILSSVCESLKNFSYKDSFLHSNLIDLCSIMIAYLEIKHNFHKNTRDDIIFSIEIFSKQIEHRYSEYSDNLFNHLFSFELGAIQNKLYSHISNKLNTQQTYKFIVECLGHIVTSVVVRKNHLSR